MVIAQENVVFRQEFVQLFLKTLQHLTQQNVCLRFRDAVGVVVLAAGAAVADGILGVVPVGSFPESLFLLDEINHLLGRAERDLRRILIRVCGNYWFKTLINAVDNRSNLRTRYRRIRAIRPVRVAADNPSGVERFDIDTVGVGKCAVGAGVRQAKRVCSKLGKHTARHIDVQIGNILIAHKEALIDGKIQIASCPVGLGALRLRIACGQQDHLERFAGRDLFRGAICTVRVAADDAGFGQRHHVLIKPAALQHIGEGDIICADKRCPGQKKGQRHETPKQAAKSGFHSVTLLSLHQIGDSITDLITNCNCLGETTKQQHILLVGIYVDQSRNALVPAVPGELCKDIGE